MTKPKITTVAFRYLVGPGTIFTPDAAFNYENAKVTVGGEVVDGAGVQKVEVTEEGKALLITCTVPSELVDAASLTLSID